MNRYAATLEFYSPKAYGYLRDLCLPNRRTLQLPLESIDCSSSLMQNALHALPNLKGNKICAIVIDGMHFRTIHCLQCLHIIVAGGIYARTYADFSQGLVYDSLRQEC